MLDGAHLKGDFKGTMLLAVAMDGNNQIMPLAYGICKSESLENWSLFLLRLRDCIGDSEHLTFISDRAQAIATSIANIFPNASHGICCYHLYCNLRTKFGRGRKLKTLFYKAAKAYTEAEFLQLFENIKQTRLAAWQYLVEADPNKWSRAYFTGNRYNMMTSNSAESINALSRYARKMPIMMLVDFFRATMQQWFFQRRNQGGYILRHSVFGDIC